MTKTYTLKIDKKRDEVLSIVFNYLSTEKNFFRALMHEGLQDVFLDFLQETADKNHQLGWCEDPTCVDKQ